MKEVSQGDFEQHLETNSRIAEVGESYQDVYKRQVLGETSGGEWLSFIPGCLIFTGISMVYYFWWGNHWEGNRISE